MFRQYLSLNKRTRVTLLITAGLVLVGTAVAVTLIVKSRLEALTVTPPPNGATATLYVSIFENGQPAAGHLYISDSCDQSPIPSRGGVFMCTLKSKTNPDKVSLNGLSFNDSSRVYSIPITTSDVLEAIEIPKGANLNLQVSIDNAGNLKLYQLKNWDYVDITSTGIQI